MASFMGLFGALVALTVFRFIAVAVYRIYFHPLSKYPGPKLLAATRIPVHIAVASGSRDKLYQDLHREYGPIVRVAHNELSFIDAGAWKDIHGHGTKGTAGSLPHKDPVRYPESLNGAPNLINSPNDVHTRQRKIFSSAFSDRALKQQEPLFLKYINQLVSVLKKGIKENPETKFDLVRLFNFTTFDVMGDLTFGEPLHMLDNAEYDPWVSNIFGALKMSSLISLIRFYPLLWKFFKMIQPTSISKKSKNHFNHSSTRVTKRLEKGRDSQGVDLWDLVLSQKEGKGLTRPEMDSNASVFMIAGTETTATLLSGLTYLLLRNPECMAKLTREIRNEFESTDDMTMERLAALPYFAACIKEAFRIYPPVPLMLPRRTPADGTTVCGKFVPPNTTVGIPQHAMYMSERNFKRPTEFLPQRWLGDPEFDSDKKACLQPFSIGSRDCLGKNMAYHEIRLIAAKTYYHFDIELCDETGNWLDQPTFLLWEKSPLLCKLRSVR
ncbi:hypothetical protein COCC4DRAFT_169245 [Bipolaris maydis ATCC 48331]|uniref:Cytochrome P450 monooxygenase n=2 Tax=Cochliobolus heterostrophus TaxID=5016 RepID=M2UMH0_COCH5|nr:uncharacterized protein COCC4DRAFT_169245 [Bipolaris maydis ATCC 48331]EMD89153.1 hypothetical protein COCHEDRAFT_1180440 [Bipolaris maydis C5]KAJ5024816.1 cytochrome P450 [Bipolaris maydis]ENI05127.1 hypothetical protein COCC4DRAFT_169245 [Bipolaris maydis ATCC 48331]KAJ6212521.1 cytochrome P450 [Bipolaris maydis]KAJ6266182.1 cytochrome P450 [Bipolaris maydis]